MSPSPLQYKELRHSLVLSLKDDSETQLNHLNKTENINYETIVQWFNILMKLDIIFFSIYILPDISATI